MALQAVLSTSTNPWFNLALEHYLGKSLPPATHLFYWWQNRPAVIIGRFQNAWAEVDAPALQRDGIDLVRRPSGGGAVFHDEGNSNFTFWDATNDQHARSPLKDPLIQTHFAIIQQALQHWQIESEVYGRNDLGVGRGEQRRKISGSAFAYHPGKVLHHGTLLRQVNLARMGRYLRPHPLKLKGVASCPQRVQGLSELAAGITHQNLGEAILAEWQAAYGQDLSAPEHGKISWQIYQESDLPTLLQQGEDFPYARWVRPAWNWGSEVKLAHQIDFKFSFGLFTIMADVAPSQTVQQAVIYSDALDLALVTAWQDALKGCPWQTAQLLARLPLPHLSPAALAEVQAAQAVCLES